jgi:hypothetical protein
MLEQFWTIFRPFWTIFEQFGALTLHFLVFVLESESLLIFGHFKTFTEVRFIFDEIRLKSLKILPKNQSNIL